MSKRKRKPRMTATKMGKLIGRINDTHKFDELTKLMLEIMYEYSGGEQIQAHLVDIITKKQERLTQLN